MGSTLFDVKDGIATILLDRPQQRNAMSAELVAEMLASLHRGAFLEEVKVVLVHGAGKGFCAGSDLHDLSAMTPAGRHEFESESGRLGRAIAHCPKPVIAAVHGFAIGGG